MVVALLALTVALGGTSYAAIKLPKNSVGSKQLKKNAVTGSKVKDGSLFSNDFAAGQLPRGPKGDAGAPGAPGAPGAAGAQGPPGLAQVIVRRHDSTVPIGLAAGSSVNLVSMQLPAGKWFISGITNGGYFGPGNGSTFRCYILVNGAAQEPHVTLALGQGAGGTSAGSFQPSATVNSGAPRTVTLMCNHEHPLQVGQFNTPSFESSRIVAIRADSLDVANG
jgi:hypothetical protein